ncbi:tetraspanin-8-like [Dendrobium catenatum]|uniref:Tetraspanin-8 n=1 Tax=Dendrobium catenatum TaxID=906689 RepID=A0A2I0WSE0_9ASPA|nr:tetraspanin-8-like [Dendrobium catenatum]PKU78580.1 Tetraspanin-8 [Dendrobium catenatum]
MVRFSNNLIGILNFLTFLLSIPILGAGIWLSTRASTDCEKFLERPLIALGVFLLVVSLAGLIGACCSVSWLLWIYLFVMFALILLVFCFTIFAFVVTNKGAGEVVSGRGYKEYRLGDYSNWLQKRVLNEGNWAKIRSCIRDSKVCNSLSEKNQTFDQFVNDNLTPLQSGCCTPPTACNFTFVNETAWNKPQGFTNSSITDCNTWQNDPSILCYDCQSCKAGVLANLKNDWKKVAIVNIVFLIFLVIVYSIGCCAFRNNRRNNFQGWKGGNA